VKAKSVIVGIDEAGRGALAGPVMACACVFVKSLLSMPLIRDSKQLTPEQRENAYEWICRSCCFGVGMADAAFIDANGILAATERAMQDAVSQLEKKVTPTYLLVDGRDAFWFNYAHSSVIRGDESEPCIAAASIVAKVTRDRFMVTHDLATTYGFTQHKGYGTPSHYSKIAAHGISPLHRKTFLRNIHP